MFVFGQDHSVFFPVPRNVVFYLNRVTLVASQWMGLRYFVQALKRMRRCIYQTFVNFTVSLVNLLIHLKFDLVLTG
jgi:hypothetical protein